MCVCESRGCDCLCEGSCSGGREKCGFNKAAAAALRVGTRCQDVPGETALTPQRPAKSGHSLSQNASVTLTAGSGGGPHNI